MVMDAYTRFEEEYAILRVIESSFFDDPFDNDNSIRELITLFHKLDQLGCTVPATDRLKRDLIHKLLEQGLSILNRSHLSAIAKNYLQRNLLEKIGDKYDT